MNHKRYGIWRLLLRALVISLLLWTQVSCGSRSIPETVERPRNSDRQQAESIERTLQSEYHCLWGTCTPYNRYPNTDITGNYR